MNVELVPKLFVVLKQGAIITKDFLLEIGGLFGQEIRGVGLPGMLVAGVVLFLILQGGLVKNFWILASAVIVAIILSSV